MHRTGLILLAAGFSLLSPPMARAGVSPGDSFPALTSADLALGALPETSGKIVLVDFWASWCAPCKASFPAYGRLYTEFAPRGLVIVAVSVDENPADYESFVRKFSPAFSVALDKGQKLVRAVQVPTMPTSYLIDRGGRVRHVHQGFHGAATEQALRKEIEALLSTNTP
jgi:thiol-disulfide isomerase/thioredoxin